VHISLYCKIIVETLDIGNLLYNSFSLKNRENGVKQDYIAGYYLIFNPLVTMMMFVGYTPDKTFCIL